MVRNSSSADRLGCHCLRCGHNWKARTLKRSRTCPKCNDTRWDSEPLPDVDLGRVLNDVEIDIKVAELRAVIAILESRLQTLLEQKGKPTTQHVSS